MKVVHVLKKIETIDEDIRELRKLEKSLARNKSFSTPIYMSIEKQINILLGDKIKLMELKISNPPAGYEDEDEEAKPKAPVVELKKTAKTGKAKAVKAKGKKAAGRKIEEPADDIPMMTQDMIDQKIMNIESTMKKEPDQGSDAGSRDRDGDDHIKLLDIALEKGNISRQEVESEKKKVRFFKDNFPGGEY